MVRFNTALFVLCAMLGLSGCHEKKKPSAQLPPAPAPTPTTASQQPPIQQPTPQTTQEPPSVQQPAQQQTAQNETPKPKPKPQPRHPRHTATATPQKPTDEKPPEKSSQEKQNQEVARNLPPKIVIQEGGANTPGSTQPASTNTTDNNAHNEPTTGQLLDSTENNLRNIKRQLSADEQNTQAQIKDYVAQARQAIKDGDMVRAHNLAVKAHLLCDELIKQR